ncbi:MAG: DNA mismatch repair protein MutS, partial [Alphaproteobacteria bacterium]|nr:DNA mismatch repair protein MutS [Alphaproteobacteria bacterium]
GKHLGDDIPMCGVPVHAAEQYLERLIRKGFRVAICEQVEDPAAARKRGSKSVVRREVVRLVTPGTLTEDSLLEPSRANTLASLGRAGGGFALASADMSAGTFHVAAAAQGDLAVEIARLAPNELLAPDTLLADAALAPVLNALGGALTALPAVKFDSAAGERALKNHYGVSELAGFGTFSRAELSAAGALVAYLELTQKGKLPALQPLVRETSHAFMAIDAATRRNLELTATLAGERHGSLLHTIDRTMTAAGARLLGARLAAPLTDVKKIARRQDAVALFLQDGDRRAALREMLRSTPDIARALARLSVARAGPRDLAALRDGISSARAVRDLLKAATDTGEAGEAVGDLVDAIAAVSVLSDRLAHLLTQEPPFYARDGGFVRAGAHAPLDEVRALRDESRRVIATLETRLREESDTPLKIKHNGVLGFFIEVASQHADKLMTSGYRHRQTMGGAVRFSTDELSTLANRISQAAEQALAIEKELFDEMAGAALAAARDLARIADALAVLDVASSLAELAAAQRHVCPKVDDSRAFAISRGRHAVVEAALAAAHAGFVPNDCDLVSDKRLWLVTGPNMAGKSTFLRQNALIAILAQMGAYVPAERAHIGIVDRLFSRVGAGDDLAAGRSTFMVEMVETAAILNQATDKSLVILDEIGRGTATFDGLAIAWATAEHLAAKNKSRALFATHYHEMTALAERLPSLACVTMRVKEWNDTIVFLHEVVPGVADRSYGIHVAKLAGLPAPVVARAQEVLRALEEGREGHQPLARIDDLPLFNATAPPQKLAKQSKVEDMLRIIDPDALTPKEALETIYALRKTLDS